MGYIRTNYAPLKYEMQIFSKSLDLLTAAYQVTGINGLSLREVGRKIGGYVGIERPTTNDGYTWFWALHFSQRRFFLFPEWEVAILFPWSTRTSPGEKRADRPVMAYATGHIERERVDGLAEKVLQLLVGPNKRLSSTFS